ncbi:MAG: glycosyltransferase [Candidatus Omnitrophica bacterium]|nr:glycosyltransferase [Candidatus Omnitrophota bacterium]
MQHSQKAIVIPVFNERYTIEPLLSGIIALGLEGLNIFVVDDDSQDGTAAILDGVAAEHNCVKVIHRRGRRGRGLSVKAGFAAALEKGCSYILEMDGDLSHRAEDIPHFFQAVENADIVVGSRRIQDGEDLRKNLARKALSVFSNFVLRRALALDIQDCTSGFRCFKADVLKGIPLERLKSSGPMLLEEILLVCQRDKKAMREVPIKFLDRRGGRSKLGLKTVGISLLDFLRIKFTYT